VGNLLIALPIALYFSLPKCRVPDRLDVVGRATMPEATINENRELGAREHYIWANPVDPMIDAVPKTRPPKCTAKPHLSASVPATNRSHPSRGRGIWRHISFPF
jgi:hypothetical protein